MSSVVLYDSDGHRNVLLEDFSGTGLAVQANQHLIISGDEALLLDPGGHKVYTKVLGATLSELGSAHLRYLFLSHQDPDIVAASNGWLMTTDAEAWCSKLWARFVPHFGLDHLMAERLKPIPDEGMELSLGSRKLLVIPAHFLHSCGNHQLYDPTSKILYSGDLGASMDTDYREVPDFDTHIPFMEGFHRRYMASQKVMSLWANMIRSLDIEIIAPQHGALFRGKEQVNRFIDWCENLQCGLDLMTDLYNIPEGWGV